MPGLRRGETDQLFNEYEVWVLQDEKSSGDGWWGMHSGNIVNVTEKCTYNENLGDLYLTTIKKKERMFYNSLFQAWNST